MESRAALPRIPTALWIPILAAAAAAGFLLFGPEERILSLCNDDAYYYFQIARNTAHGSGVSFDGIAPTNGFHPLYFAVLVPIFALDLGDVLPIRLALVVLALAYFATSFTLHGAVKRMCGPFAAAIAAIAWALNPGFVFFARGGLEVAIYTFVASLLILEYVGRYRPDPTPAHAARLGVAAGLTVLGRTDGLLIVAAIALDALVRALRGRTSPARMASLAVAAAAPAALVVSPWLIWNRITFGTVVQVSARAHGYADHTGRWLLRDLPAQLAQRPGAETIAIALAGLAAAAIATGILRAEWRVIAPRLARVAFLLAYLALFFGSIELWYHWYRNWYFLAPAMAVLMVLSTVLLPADRGERRLAPILFLGLWLAVAGLGLRRFGVQMAAGEGTRAEVDDDARWIADHLSPDAVLGAFNAGRLGYFLPRRVVNLDGVVNNQAVAAMATRGLGRYAGAHVDYVLDRWPYVRYYFDRYSEGGAEQLEFIAHRRTGDLYRVPRSTVR